MTVGTPDARRAPAGQGVRSSRWTLAVLCAADFLVVLDGLIVAVALPAVQTDLGIPPASLQWVVNAYVLCFGGFLLLGGRLGDLYGRRRVLLLGLALFAGGALLGGLAGTTTVLVAGRAVQGLGAALMAPAALALLVTTFSEGQARTRALGWWSAVGSLGIPAGALLGGLLTASVGWRWVLLANVPAAALAALATRWVAPERRDLRAPAHLDVAGAVLATGGVALLVLAVVQTDAGSGGGVVRVGVPLAGGVLLLTSFVVAEHRTAAPLVPPEVLRTPGLGVSCLVGATLPVGLGAVLFLGTLYLQRVLEFSALETGLAYLALAIPVVAASPLVSRVMTRCGRRRVAAGGLVLQAAGVALLARAPADGTFLVDVLPGLLLVGVGAPTAFVPTTAAAMGTVTEASGLVSGIFNTAQQVGNALALSALATLAAARSDSLGARGLDPDTAQAAGCAAGFLLATAILVAGAAAARFLPLDSPGGRRRTTAG